ncbi:hypothetical protein Tco_0931992 [Tanacetum coccineum]
MEILEGTKSEHESRFGEEAVDMMGDNNMQIDEEDGDEGEDGGDSNSDEGSSDEEGNDEEDEGSRFFDETKVRDTFQEDLGSYEEKAAENVKENHGKGNTNNNVVASPSIEGPKKICIIPPNSSMQRNVNNGVLRQSTTIKI